MTDGPVEIDGDEPLARQALAALADVIDPEIGLDIVALGLVYRVAVDDGQARVQMTMTSPACPMGEQIVDEVEQRLRAIDGIDDADVELVWDPPWEPDRITPAARRALGWPG